MSPPAIPIHRDGKEFVARAYGHVGRGPGPLAAAHDLDRRLAEAREALRERAPVRLHDGRRLHHRHSR